MHFATLLLSAYWSFLHINISNTFYTFYTYKKNTTYTLKKKIECSRWYEKQIKLQYLCKASDSAPHVAPELSAIKLNLDYTKSIVKLKSIKIIEAICKKIKYYEKL